MINTTIETDSFTRSLEQYVTRAIVKSNSIMQEATANITAIAKSNVVARSKNGAPALVQQIFYNKDKDGYYVMVNADYASYVEFGTNKTEGKFFLSDAVDKVEPILIKDILNKAL